MNYFSTSEPVQNCVKAQVKRATMPKGKERSIIL
ncbi:hypothetical protein CLMAG_36280 [Clostridium magnum DSM 2767]|uniref:Uncharacterized protein n=1 Tax=Clostridium magnum DSM 2767 TaxID=1121326 RepID=A0A161X933_9CLOT|nr:hypothetical protein CLMAG_36280 [Clostridium magnum DSM 2767]